MIIIIRLVSYLFTNILLFPIHLFLHLALLYTVSSGTQVCIFSLAVYIIVILKNSVPPASYVIILLALCSTLNPSSNTYLLKCSFPSLSSHLMTSYWYRAKFFLFLQWQLCFCFFFTKDRQHQNLLDKQGPRINQLILNIMLIYFIMISINLPSTEVRLAELLFSRFVQKHFPLGIQAALDSQLHSQQSRILISDFLFISWVIHIFLGYFSQNKNNK